MSTAPVVKIAGTGAAAATFTTASYTPQANSRELAYISGYKATASPALPTITDTAGNNWVLLAELQISTNANPNIRSAWYISDDTGSSPASRTATVAATSGSQIGVIIFDVLSADTDGTLAQAAVFGEDLSTGDPSCTFGSTPGASNITLLGASFGGGSTVTKPASFASIANAVSSTARINAAAYDITSASIGPNQYTSLNTRAIIIGIELAPAGAATQNITGALFTNSNTFYGATVTRGDVGITGALFTNANTVYAATITQPAGSQGITGALFSNANSFFGATVSASYTIIGALFTDADTFFGASVTTTVGITGSRFDNANTFFASTVSQASSQSITGALYANDNQFFGSTIANGITGGGGSEWKKWYVPGLEKQEKAQIKRIERTVKKKVAEAIETAGPGILSGDLEQIVKAEVADAAPASSNDWLTPDVLQFIINRIEAQMRKAFVRKQQEAEDDDEDALILAA